MKETQEIEQKTDLEARLAKYGPLLRTYVGDGGTGYRLQTTDVDVQLYVHDDIIECAKSHWTPILDQTRIEESRFDEEFPLFLAREPTYMDSPVTQRTEPKIYGHKEDLSFLEKAEYHSVGTL